MKKEIVKRVLDEANYILETKKTIREIAFENKISKSTVHKDITQILKKVNYPLYLEVQGVLEKNKKERHIRGGEATKNKYKKVSG